MVIAKYRTEWQHLSRRHKKIDDKISEILNNYAADKLEHLSYALIGTFGAGKTQLYKLKK